MTKELMKTAILTAMKHMAEATYEALDVRVEGNIAEALVELVQEEVICKVLTAQGAYYTLPVPGFKPSITNPEEFGLGDMMQFFAEAGATVVLFDEDGPKVLEP